MPKVENIGEMPQMESAVKLDEVLQLEEPKKPKKSNNWTEESDGVDVAPKLTTKEMGVVEENDASWSRGC